PLNDDVVRGSALVGIVGAVAAIWNVWHTLMQKFGILRVYAAKSSVAVDRRTPPWVDRLLIFGPLPLLAVWVGPAQRDVIAHQRAHKPPLQRALSRPILAYAGYTALIGFTYFFIDYGKDYGLHDGRADFFGIKISTWLFSFAIWQSIAHFYFDGFLWKMRAP